ncbi:hypothetical protein QL285_071347 [Trifolium repens]|nr:hypothetical protein QL285_071347 [Trifolium repens]
MGAGDVSRSDVEQFVPVRQSTRDIDRRGLWWWPKPGLLKCSRRHQGRPTHMCGMCDDTGPPNCEGLNSKF